MLLSLITEKIGPAKREFCWLQNKSNRALKEKEKKGRHIYAISLSCKSLLDRLLNVLGQVAQCGRDHCYKGVIIDTY